MPGATAPGGPTLLWQAYPLGLLGADQSGVDRTCRRSLRELIRWLPHVASLGADAMLLGPIFASLSHGYDTVTHRAIDDRIGTEADLDDLVAAAAAHGIGVVLDGAFAYASREFWRLSDPAERDRPWFLRDGDGHLVPWRVDALVTPDYAVAEYRSYVVDVLTHWLGRGIAGWRLDSAWSVPAPFWREVLARVRSEHPGAWFLAQVFDDDLPPVVDATTVSSGTEYALMHDVRDGLGGPRGRLRDALAGHRENSGPGRRPHTFLGNHDFARLADVVPPDLLSAAFCLLLTLPGVPGVYYGDEVAATAQAWRQTGDDGLLRPPLSLDDLRDVDAAGRDLLDAVRRLGTFRQANPWLTEAVLDDVVLGPDGLSYRVTGAGGSVRVRINLHATEPSRFPADDERPRLALGTAVPRADGVEVPERGWAIHRDER